MNIEQKLPIKRIIRFTSAVIFALLIAFVAFLTPSHACSVNQSGPMPVCKAIGINSDSYVVLIEPVNRFLRTSNVLVGEEQHSSRILDIHISKSDKPITVVISHYEPTIFRFTGDVGNVEKVVAMGSRRGGWDQFAVVGIPHGKISAVPVIGVNKGLTTSCSAPPKSCVPAQFFEVKDRLGSLSGDHIFDLLETKMQIDERIKVIENSQIEIPTFNKSSRKVEFPDESHLAGLSGWQKNLALYKFREDNSRIYLTHSELVSPVRVVVDNSPRSWMGIKKLVEQDILIEPTDKRAEDVLRNFSNNFGLRYRSKHDPNFKFLPPVDFVVNSRTKSFEMPRDLQRMSSIDRRPLALLVDDKIPGISGGENTKYCFLTTKAEIDISNTMQSIFCNSNAYFAGSSADWWSDTGIARTIFKDAKNVEIERRRRSANCNLVDIPPDAEVVAIATAGGRSESGPPSILSARTMQARSFQTLAENKVNLTRPEFTGVVDINFKKREKSYLIITTTWSANWNFKVADFSDLSGILVMSDAKQSFTGVPSGTIIKQIVPRDRALRGTCKNALLLSNPLLGGPSLILFEMMLDRISNRSIDQFFSKGPPPIAESQTEEAVTQYSTFLIQ